MISRRSPSVTLRYTVLQSRAYIRDSTLFGQMRVHTQSRGQVLMPLLMDLRLWSWRRKFLEKRRIKIRIDIQDLSPQPVPLFAALAALLAPYTRLRNADVEITMLSLLRNSLWVMVPPPGYKSI